MNIIYFGDNLPILKELPSESVDLFYIDPPFNTGKVQSYTSKKTIRDENGDRKGFQGNSYQTIDLGTRAYQDIFENIIEQALPLDIRDAFNKIEPYASIGFLEGFLRPRLIEAYRILKPHGGLYFHIDYREVHYCKILLDSIFGRDSFINEIIWAYDYGGKSKTRWPAKHDNILYYVKDPASYIFNSEAIDREPYMAPGLVGPDKAKRGKLPTDTWWHTIVGTNSKERTGYPTQKPIKIINRIIQASSLPGQVVMDFFAGSGTVGESCLTLDRRFILIDNNIESLEVMARRFAGVKSIQWVNFNPKQYQDKKIDIKVKNKDNQQADFDYFASLARYFRSEYEEESVLWEDSPFDYIVELSPPRKGSLGKKMLTKWCQVKGLIVETSTEKAVDAIINGHRIVIKTSFLWSEGFYKFQQIRDQNYDYIICLGLSPQTAHCWIMGKDYVLANSTSQHGGSHGTGTSWFTVHPDNPEEWLIPCGGTLDNVFKILLSLGRT
jgi:site-specific DNA-methyltransferase (adenine-specific)